MKKALVLICMGCVLLSGCGSKDEAKETTTKATTTTTAKVVDSLGDQTTTTKKVEGAIIIGDNTEASQTTTTVIENEEPAQSDEATTTTTAVTTKKPESATSEGSFSSKDAVIVYKSAKISIDDEISDIIAVIGEPDDMYSSPSCLYDGDDKTFIFGYVTIFTYPDGDKDKVLEVIADTDEATTPKGLKIGMTYEEVEALYGKGEFDGISLKYTDGGVTLSAAINDNKVVALDLFAE